MSARLRAADRRRIFWLRRWCGEAPSHSEYFPSHTKTPGRAGGNVMIPRADRERNQETLRFSADALPRFSTRSYSTTWFSLRVESPARSTAEMWTKTSLSLPFGLMNPYPLVGLNHLTVPFCGILSLLR